MSSSDDRAKRLLETLASLPRPQRPAALDAGCEGDETLRTSVLARAAAIGLPITEAGLTPPATFAQRRPAELVGCRIAGCKLTRLIDCGGMGCVFEAEQRGLERTVAVKLIRPDVLSPQSRDRFQLEATVLAGLTHDNIAHVYDGGVAPLEGDDLDPEPVPYCVMEYLPLASPITTYARQRELNLEQRLRLFADACDAVEYVHTRGVLHRDLKPSNILVTGGHPPKVKVIDFGLAQTAFPTPGGAAGSETGRIAGTIQYMSPEQCDADPHVLTHASDAYALGLVLYELLTDELPYVVPTPRTESDWARARDVIQRQAPSPPRRHGRRLPAEIERIIGKALAKNPAQRYERPRELATALRDVLAGRQPAGTPPLAAAAGRLRRHSARRPFIAAAVAVLLIVLLAEFLLVPTVYQWTGLVARYDDWFSSVAPPRPSAPALDRFRLVRITDETQASLQSIAADAGLEDVSADDWSSVRRLHGRLMEHIAPARPRAVVFDIAFPGETPHDEHFVRGVKALAAQHIDVVIINMFGWVMPSDGYPPTSRDILPHVRTGRATAGMGVGGRYYCDLLVDRAQRDPMISLALEAYGAVKRPGWRLRPELDAQGASLAIRYAQHPDPATPEVVRWGGEADTITPGGLYEFSGVPEYGLHPGDRIAYTLVEPPTDDEVAQIAVDYQDLLAADESACRQLVQDKVVVIGDFRRGADTPPGMSRPLVIGQVASIAALLDDASLLDERTGGLFRAVLPTIAIVGVALPWLLRRRLPLCGAVSLGALLVLLAPFATYYWFSYLMSPIVPVVVLLFGAFMGAWIIRQRRAYT